jgi:hypothetical protein
MRRSLLRISLAALAPLLCAQSPGIIEGRVTNSVTGEGVAGVEVRFSDRHSYVHDTVTDSTGSYRITGLDDGDYHGTFTKDGFADDRGTLANPVFHVSAGLTALADKQLKPWGSLRGRVVDEDGKPAAGVRVEKDPTPPGLLDGDTVTDENGEFAFKDLPAGSYMLVAKPESKIRMQDGVRVGTVAMYYPSATEMAHAVRIPVRTGDNVSGIEIRLKSVPVHRVAGVVLNPAGKPVAHATVKLMGEAGSARQTLVSAPTMIFSATGSMSLSSPLGSAMSGVVGPGAEPEAARVESGDDGAFEFAAVEAGDWRLSAAVGEYDEVPLSGVTSLTVSGAPVSDKDVEDVHIRMATAFPVVVALASGSAEAPPTGRHCDPSGCVAEHGPILLSLTAEEGQPRVRVADPANNLAKLNAAFPGRYRVMQGLGIQGDPYVAAVMWGGRDVKGQVVELAPGAGPFEIVYKSGLGKVRGTVEKGDGASVFLVSNTSGDILTYRQVTCGAGGSFEIGQVPPGDYFIVAFDRTNGSELPAADLPASIMPLASSLQVESGSTASVDLRMNKWPW